MKFVQGQACEVAEGNARVSRESNQGFARSEASVRNAKRCGRDVRPVRGTVAR